MPATRTAWAGAVEFGGFMIHLAAYPLIQSRSAQSFKTLCACHQAPVMAPKRCSVDDRALEATEMLKGHQTGKDTYAVIPPEAAETLRSAEATGVLKIEALPVIGSLPMHLVTGHYRIVPNDKIPGSEQPVQILWNGLIATGRAVVTEWVMRAGSRDSLLVIHADAFGLTGNTLPYSSELRDAPEFKPVENEQAAQMFEQFAAVQGINMDDFAHTAYESSYEQRRASAIEAALSGKPIKVDEAKPAEAGAPDLMAMMAAALGDAGAKPTKKAPAKSKSKSKVTA